MALEKIYRRKTFSDMKPPAQSTYRQQWRMLGFSARASDAVQDNVGQQAPER